MERTASLADRLRVHYPAIQRRPSEARGCSRVRLAQDGNASR